MSEYMPIDYWSLGAAGVFVLFVVVFFATLAWQDFRQFAVAMAILAGFTVIPYYLGKLLVWMGVEP